MIDLYAPEQVRAMDVRAFEHGVPSLALMERAAGHLARAIVTAGGRGYGLRVAVLCGTGNNGGDGLAAARRLRAWGAHATVCLVGGTDRLSPDAAHQLRRWQEIGGRLSPDVPTALAGADVAVDCLLGTGSRGELLKPYRSAVEQLNGFPGQVVACDLPTGVDADNGAVPGIAVHADVTVTLGAHKRGLWLWPARGHCGDLQLGDIGIVDETDTPAAVVLEDRDAAELLRPPPPAVEKRGRGVVLAIAGAPGMGGAAGLVARGAMAAGAGLVTMATSAATRDVVAPVVPEALTVALPFDDTAAALELLKPHLDAADAVAIGPGLGHETPVAELVRRLVAEVSVPLVVDADGLNVFRGEGDHLAEHAAPLLVVTPHVREYARLCGADPATAWADRINGVPDSARRWRAVVVAKGAGSLVAAPDGATWVNASGSPALATGGTGDVLTGMIAAVLAEDAAAARVAAAVHLHGLAGQLAGTGRAARSVTALDVAAAVRAAWQRLDDTAAARPTTPRPTTPRSAGPRPAALSSR